MPLVSLTDFEIHYESHGAGDCCVVMIHGLGSSGADWAFQIPALSARYRLICPDLRGSGLSGKPYGPYSIAGFADDLWQLLDHLQVATCHIVGFSLGGAVALEMALRRTDRADKLVLINALPSYRIDHWRKWLEAHSQLALVRWLGLPRAARIVARRMFPHDFQAPMRRRLEQEVGRNARRPYLDSLRALMHWCALARLDRLASPTLILAGEHDYTPVAEKRQWAAQMGAQFAVVVGSRHGTPFDAIEATNSALLAFLANQPLPSLAADTRFVAGDYQT